MQTRTQRKAIIAAGWKGLAVCSCRARLLPGVEYVEHRKKCKGRHVAHYTWDSEWWRVRRAMPS